MSNKGAAKRASVIERHNPNATTTRKLRKKPNINDRNHSRDTYGRDRQRDHSLWDFAKSALLPFQAPEDCFHIIDAPTPGAAADVLQRGPQPGVIRQVWVGL